MYTLKPETHAQLRTVSTAALYPATDGGTLADFTARGNANGR